MKPISELALLAAIFAAFIILITMTGCRFRGHFRFHSAADRNVPWSCYSTHRTAFRTSPQYVS